MKVSVCITVKNEEDSIGKLLDSLFKQSKKPDEVVICDGKSQDGTAAVIKKYINKSGPMNLIIQESNRAEGRNIAIENASHEIVVVTDGGCVADKYWLERITEPFDDKTVDIVSGYYQPIIAGLLDKLVYIYTSVMPDQVDQSHFLPSHRSVAFRKSLWKKIGGYPAEMNSSEDLMFNFKAKKIGAKFVLAKNAIVKWVPRSGKQSIFRQFYVMAESSARFGIIRKNVRWIFFRYLFGLILLLFGLKYHFFIVILLYCYIAYWVYLLKKHYRYLNDWRAIFVLPIFQTWIDLAVIAGTSTGLIKDIDKIQHMRKFVNNL